jgi:hypothetical protein
MRRSSNRVGLIVMLTAGLCLAGAQSVMSFVIVPDDLPPEPTPTPTPTPTVETSGYFTLDVDYQAPN